MPSRLESWKEIAAHFGRRVRTVQRWEKEEGLPVHRHAHRLRGTVSAVPEELDAWWASRLVPPAGDRAEESPPAGGGAGENGRVPDLHGREGARRRPAVAAALLVAGLAAAGWVAVVTAGRRAPASPHSSHSSPSSGAEDPATPRVLEARYLIHRGSAAEVDRALALCSGEAARADADPAAKPAEKASIHECLAHAALARVRMGRGSPSDGLLDATREAERAIALDPRRADAVAIAAWAGFLRDWNPRAAEAGYRRAIAIDPAAGLAHHGFAHLLSGRGRHDEAIAELRRAQRAQPLSAALNDDGCWFFYRARRYGEGIAEAERALTLEPGRVGAMQCILDARAAQGDYRAAREAAVAILRALGDSGADAIGAAPPEQAVRLLDRRLLERLDARRPALQSPATPYAFLYASLGDRDRTLAWLERAAADHDPVLLVVRVHPAFDNLRGDPRLEPLLRRAGV